ncbi:unnamed protein product [Ceutorhynchus assimilis]|uniref:Major facilitator superfamily (MFS) profile domain-containing protein n=1 Tax=Ceutorhynchus assimilis TaxID=467358 RepID=A0A9N9MPW6_9CUCU|nr:unnamed protein product [Ceutorhynchus assimilis]
MNNAKKFHQYFATVAVCLGAMGSGINIGWTANINENLKKGDLNGVKIDLSWAGSIMCLGAVFVMLPIGYMADKLGRKPTVLLMLVPFILGWLLIIFTQHNAMLMVGRFLTGMAGGAFSIMGPLYTSEIAEKQIRGTLGTFFQMFLTFGILWANVLGWVIPIVIYTVSCAIIPLSMGLLFMFQPETPVYLIKKDKREEAIKVFTKLRGKDYDPSEEILAIEKQVEHTEALKSEFKTQLMSKQGKKASFICFMIMFYQQMCGIKAVMFYSEGIFVEAASSVSPQLSTVILGIVHVAGTALATWLVEKLGRKILLIASSGAMCLSTLALGIYFLLKDKELVSASAVTAMGWLPLSSLVIYIIAFSVGLGPIAWLCLPEIFPAAIKARMSSYAGMLNWFLAFLVSVGYQNVSDLVGAYTCYMIFSFISGSCVFFVLFYMPETKGKTFQEIQDELGQ